MSKTVEEAFEKAKSTLPAMVTADEVKIARAAFAAGAAHGAAEEREAVRLILAAVRCTTFTAENALHEIYRRIRQRGEK